MTINFVVLRHQYLYSVAAAMKRDLKRRQKSQNQGMTHLYSIAYVCTVVHSDTVNLTVYLN